jgi:hypothetical protein
MNAADFLGARFFRVDVAYEDFEQLELRCRSCFRRHGYVGAYRLLEADRPALSSLSARLIYFKERRGTERSWDLFLPLSAIKLERYGLHLFHELEVIWDRRLIGLDPPWVEKMLPGFVSLPMPATHGRLPRS